MAARTDVVERVAQHALAVDDESGTDYAELAHAVLLAHMADAVFAADLAVVVGQQAHRESVLVAKLGMPQPVVATDAENHAIQAGELVFMIAEVDGFDRAERRVVARIEEKHDMFASAQRR